MTRDETAHGFVIMPFRNDPDTLRFWKTMREAASRYEHLAIHRFGSDSLTDGHDLFDAIRAHIRHASFCLADFTPDKGEHPNLNVLTEAGIALGADVKLYVIARTRSYSRFQRGLPSDWQGHYVEVFPPTDSGGQWEGLFFDFFEKVLRDLDIPTTQASEKARTSHAHQMHWLMNVVERLREQCRSLYGEGNDGPVWCRKGVTISGHPTRFTFPLESPEHAPGVTITVGAFLDKWERGGTPLGLDVKTPDREFWYPAPVPDVGLYEVTTDDAVEAVIGVLDRALVKYTPDLKRPTPLAQIVGEWKEAADTLRKVCESSPDLVGSTKRKYWTNDGFLMDFDVDGSRYSVTVGIDFDTWRERGRTPCWISVGPREGEAADLLKRLKLPYLRALDDSGSKLVPVPVDGDFQDALQDRIQRIGKACRKAAAEQQAADAAASNAETERVPRLARFDGEGDADDETGAGDDDTVNSGGRIGIQIQPPPTGAD